VAGTGGIIGAVWRDLLLDAIEPIIDLVEISHKSPRFVEFKYERIYCTDRGVAMTLKGSSVRAE
jgi:hypothetical protein